MKVFGKVGNTLDSIGNAGPKVGEKKRRLSPFNLILGSIVVGAALTAGGVMLDEEDASTENVLLGMTEGSAKGAGFGSELLLRAGQAAAGITADVLRAVRLEEIPRVAGDVKDFALGGFQDGRDGVDSFSVEVDFDFED